MRRCHPILLLALLALACNRDAAGPGSRKVQLAPLAGDAQFGLAAALLTEPLQVVVADPVTEEPVEDVTVTWRVVEGGGQVTSASSTTDVRGIAATTLRLGSGLGVHVVEARAETPVGGAARFTAHAVERPVIHAISPASAASGQTVVVTGANFSGQAEHNTVRFDGVKGRVTQASTTRLEVVVPACVPSRTVAVHVSLGPVLSAGAQLATTGSQATPLSLQPGEARTFADPADLECVRLPGGLSSARYLFIPQNVATIYSAALPFELTTRDGGAPITALLPSAPPPGAADAFELRLRQRERGLVAAGAELRRELRLMPRAIAAIPQVGEQRKFKVLDPDNKPVTITAEVKVVNEHVIIYQDLDAPAGGFQAANFTYFANLFDDFIYETTTAAFGAPSDIDNNGRVILLFTPRINALTRRGDASFIAGYFYGCDLVSAKRCPETNSGEIFYALVPDPDGKFGDRRLATTVQRSVAPVMAHEFQHMIHFAQRNETLDALWLSEALAHTAEELVAGTLLARGEEIQSIEFLRANLVRAARFLGALPSTSMIAEEPPGTLELRGAGWLLLRYLRAHYGGDALLRKLTQTELSSTLNVATQTGQPWGRLLGDFAVALYADRAPDITTAIPARYTFGSLPVRTLIISEMGSYPLNVSTLPFAESSAAGQLPSSASAIYVVNTPAGTSYAPGNITFTGRNGGAFAGYGTPQFTVFRVR